MTDLISNNLEGSIDYPSYRKLIDQLLTEGKTSGPNQTEKLISFTKLNVQRMKRLDKTVTLIPELRQTLDQIITPQIWLVITEAWCGDAAQIVPLFGHIERYTEKIILKLVFRDEEPELMDQFLTNGGRAIPKLIIVDAELHEILGVWGPRPSIAQQMVMDYKVNPDTPKEEFDRKLHTWFARDKTLSTQQELIQLLDSLKSA